MRQGQQNKRMRGRNRKGPNPMARSYESNGGDVKLRGTALHIAEKYVQLARDAQSSGDRVAAENYFQHAEHYYRIVAAAQAQMPQPQPIVRNDDDLDEDEEREFRVNGGSGDRPPMGPGGQPYGLSDPQPYVNGATESDDESGIDSNGNDINDGFPRPERHDMGGGGGQRHQGQGGQGGHGGQGGQGGGGQGGGGQGGQGHNQGFRRRRPFRERYGDRDRERNASGGGQGDGERGNRDEPAPAARPESGEPSDD
jgi:Domain of unknown function (DUF4167)